MGVRALELGSRLLGPTGFALHREFAFELHLELAQCQYLQGDHERAEALFHELLRHESSLLLTLGLAGIRVSLYESQGRYAEAWRCGVACLSKLGVHLEPDPTEAFVGSLAGQVIGSLGARSFDDVLRGDIVTDPA